MYLNKRVSLSASFISKLCPEAYWSKDYLMVTTQQVVCQKVELKMLQRATHHRLLWEVQFSGSELDLTPSGKLLAPYYITVLYVFHI